jgi:hypothetical protein
LTKTIWLLLAKKETVGRVKGWSENRNKKKKESRWTWVMERKDHFSGGGLATSKMKKGQEDNLINKKEQGMRLSFHPSVPTCVPLSGAALSPS